MKNTRDAIMVVSSSADNANRTRDSFSVKDTSSNGVSTKSTDADSSSTEGITSRTCRQPQNGQNAASARAVSGGIVRSHWGQVMPTMEGILAYICRRHKGFPTC